MPKTKAKPVELFPHQEEGYRWLASQKTALLGDDMGLGKTIQSIYAANAIGARTILVIAPTIALYNWVAEFEKFSAVSHRCRVIDTGKKRFDDRDGVVITTPALITRDAVREQILARRWDVVIADEADVFKSREAKRTIAFYGYPIGSGVGTPGVISVADRVWLLTGTPAPNHAGELWTHLRALRPNSLRRNDVSPPMSYHAFIHRYCVIKRTTFGDKPSGNNRAHLEELRSRALRPFILRRLKRNVLKDLPPIQYSTVTVPLSAKGKRALEAYLDELDPELRAQLTESEELLDVLRQNTEHLSTLTRLTGALKVAPAVELCEQILSHGGRKVIVFAIYRDTIAMLEDALSDYNPVVITGDVSANDRTQIVERFQTDDRTQVFIGQIQACATAVTLTAASQVLFVESSWTPRDNAQAAARAHRIGQTENVQVRLMCLAHSVDQMITETLARKVQTIRELLQ